MIIQATKEHFVLEIDLLTVKWKCCSVLGARKHKQTEIASADSALSYYAGMGLLHRVQNRYRKFTFLINTYEN